MEAISAGSGLTGIRIYPCPHCSSLLPFSTFSNCRLHYLKKHTHECPICHRHYKCLKTHIWHQAIISNKEEYFIPLIMICNCSGSSCNRAIRRGILRQVLDDWEHFCQASRHAMPGVGII